MAERRTTNSELRLKRLESEEPDPGEEHGILELFIDEQQADEDEPLARDDSVETD